MSDNPARVLVVEDEADIRRFVRLALQAEGHEVFEADTLQRGLLTPAHAAPTWWCWTWACPTAMVWT